MTAYSVTPSFSKKNVGFIPGDKFNSGILYFAPIKCTGNGELMRFAGNVDKRTYPNPCFKISLKFKLIQKI